MPLEPTPQDRRERVVLALTILLLAMLGAGWCWAERRSTLAGESARMEVLGATLEANVARLLRGTLAGLRSVRRELPRWSPGERAPFAERRLAALRDAMSGVVVMQWRDADGRLLADSQTEGPEPALGAAFALARARPDPERWSAAPPRAAAPGVWHQDLALAMLDAEGRFDGALLVTLERRYFDDLLASTLYAPDMRATVLHGAGRIATGVPHDVRLEGEDAARPNAPFSRHLASGRQASVQMAPSPVRPITVLAAFRTLRGEGLGMEPPMVLVLSRDVDQILVPWRLQTGWLAAALLSAAAAASLGLAGVQRRRAAARAEAERLHLALRGGDLALWDLDLVADRSIVNERWSTMLGYRPGDIEADDAGWRALLHPDDHDRVVALQEAHLQGRSDAFEATYRIRHREGHYIWILDRGRVLARAADGRPLRMVGTHMDVTAAMEAEATLRRSEQSLAVTLQSIGDGVIATDATGIVTRINEAARRLTGWEGDSAIGRPLGDVFRIRHAAQGSRELDPVARVLASGSVVARESGTVLTARDGREAQIAESAAPIRAPGGEIQGVVLVFSDVTEQYRMLQALRQSERKSRGLLDALQSGVIVHGEGLRIVDANPAACRILGLEREALLQRGGLPHEWRLLGENGQTLRRDQLPVVRALQQQGPVLDIVVGMQHQPGAEPVWVLCTAFSLLDDHGHVQEVVVTFIDFSARKRAEAAQRAAQDELAATLAAVPDLLFDIDIDGLVIGMHAPKAELLVMPLERQVGRNVAETLPPDAAARVMEVLRDAARDGHGSGLPYALELRSGRRWFELTASRRSVPAGEKPRCILLARDVTDRVLADEQRAALERQVREAQRIESLGTLAGGIAHDFNNILAAILGNASLARDTLPTQHPALDSLDRIHKAGLRARSLVQQILTFSRRDPAALQAQALKPLVEETVTLLRATLPATVRLVVVLSEAPLVAEADATQLQQVLMNLCTNAWHALPEGRGRIEIGLAEAAADPEAPPAALRAQRHAHLWVSDDGSGMDEATRARVFDPFFTTKPVGQGTGLGLSVAHGIVRGHGGDIELDTAPGQGSTFHVRLPLSARAAEPAAAMLPPAVDGGAGRHALVLDDDEVMALTAQALLERAGWRVTRCHGADQALALLTDATQHFDVVVSDHNMPDMSGTDFALRVRQLRAALPVIISSGFVSDELRRQAAAAGVRALLHKEQTLERLAALAHEVARGAAGGGS